MSQQKLEFKTRKMKIGIDYDRCVAAIGNTSAPTCGFACVKACRLYGRNILKIENNRPVLAVTEPKEIERLDNECMSCEYNCQQKGSSCIQIDVHIA